MLGKKVWIVVNVALLALLAVAAGVIGPPTGGAFVARAQGPSGSPERYRVECSGASAAGASVASDEATRVTPGGPPESPSHLQASQVSSTTITFSWWDNADNEQGFSVERWVNGGWWNWIAQVGADVTTCRNTGLTPYTIYAYRVQAFNADGVSAYSQIIAVTTKEY